ncbi:hypothetical protein [Scytonema sp. PRP1]|uniref:hypothetical protein n=1 Tax=Scytonema sp. PRP1 TaxID=3120513 RepID=UPI002FD0425E
MTLSRAGVVVLTPTLMPTARLLTNGAQECGVTPNYETDNPSGMPMANATAIAERHAKGERSRLRREILLQRWLTDNW